MMRKITMFFNKKQDTDTDRYEKCVLCGKETDVKFSVPVGERKTYMIGVGQLCPECCMEVYHTADLRDI